MSVILGTIVYRSSPNNTTTQKPSCTSVVLVYTYYIVISINCCTQSLISVKSIEKWERVDFVVRTACAETYVVSLHIHLDYAL